ncbi:MAG: hypothetical protein ACQERB_04075 [Promethearchaeati archaeon]
MENDNEDKTKGPKYVSGPGGVCICPLCGKTKSRTKNIPCTEEICPNCGAKMIMES